MVYAVGFSAAFYFTFPRTAFTLPVTVFYVTGCSPRCRLWTPPWSTYFPATHDPRVVVPPTPVSPPVLARCVCAIRVAAPAPRRHHHRRQMCSTMCPPGCATICLLGIYTMCERSPPHVWCPHDDAVVVHTTRWRGSKSTPVISILQNKSLTLFLVRTFCRIRGLYGLQD